MKLGFAQKTFWGVTEKKKKNCVNYAYIHTCIHTLHTFIHTHMYKLNRGVISI